MMPYAHHHPATHTGWPICCHSVSIMGGYLLILPMIFLPFFLPLLQRKIKKERNWKQRPPLKKKGKKDKSRGGFNYKSFSVIKNQVHRRSTLKVPCVTISLFPNPSVNRQPEEGCTHFHFSALAELLRKNTHTRWYLLLPSCCFLYGSFPLFTHGNLTKTSSSNTA